MSDKVKVILIISALILVLGGLLAFQSFKDYLHRNPEDTVGNTAGNLNNGGYFCQIGDRVFFANGYDGGRLYVMNVDESDIKKISDSAVSYINADENYIYYFVNDMAAPSGVGGFTFQILGLYRSDYRGKKVQCLDKVNCGVVKLLGNTLYYQRYDDQSGKTLQSMNIQSRDSEAVLKFPANPAANYGTKIYYNGMEDDHYLYCYDTGNGSNSVVYDGNVWNPDVQGGYVYFMNVADDYTLCRYELATGDVQTLTEDRIDQFLVCGNYIFYQKNGENDAALKVMNTDGSEPRIIAEGNYTGLSATSKFVYFAEFGIEAPVYKVSLENSSFQVMTFDGAREAAMENLN